MNNQTNRNSLVFIDLINYLNIIFNQNLTDYYNKF